MKFFIGIFILVSFAFSGICKELLLSGNLYGPKLYDNMDSTHATIRLNEEIVMEYGVKYFDDYFIANFLTKAGQTAQDSVPFVVTEKLKIVNNDTTYIHYNSILLEPKTCSHMTDEFLCLNKSITDTNNYYNDIEKRLVDHNRTFYCKETEDNCHCTYDENEKYYISFSYTQQEILEPEYWNSHSEEELLDDQHTLIKIYLSKDISGIIKSSTLSNPKQYFNVSGKKSENDFLLFHFGGHSGKLMKE